MANKVLKDPIAVKEKINGTWPWSFKAPTKDNAHSGSLSAGNDYGIGHRQPVGKEMASGPESGPIPQKARCFSPNEIFNGSDKRG